MTNKASDGSLAPRKGGTLGCSFGRKKESEVPSAFSWQAGSEASPKKQAIILDMGEASREQGFRLNGCR